MSTKNTTVGPIEVTTRQLADMGASLTIRFNREFGGIPTRMDGASPLTEFATRFGWERQPNVLEYLALTSVLLVKLGRKDARDIVMNQFEWFVEAFATGAEPLPVSVFIRDRYKEAGV